jgi:hypothetical protein
MRRTIVLLAALSAMVMGSFSLSSRFPKGKERTADHDAHNEPRLKA